MDTEVLLKLLDILPQWFIISGISLYALHKICDKNIKMLVKLASKWRVRDERNLKIQILAQGKLISENEKSVSKLKQEICNINSKVDTIIDIIKKD